MNRFLIALTLLIALLPTHRANAARPHSSGYTVSRTAKGIRVSLHFQRHRYPQRALVWVTAVLTNLSHPSLYTRPPIGPARPLGLCTPPVTAARAIKAHGQSAEPISPITYPMPSCPVALPVPLPVGHSIVERQLIVLWSGRIQAQAMAWDHRHGHRAFVLNGPIAHLVLYRAPAPTIRADMKKGKAAVQPPPGASGFLYYRNWGSCQLSLGVRDAPNWTKSKRATISLGCLQVEVWHIDAGWINSPVSSVNLQPH